MKREPAKLPMTNEEIRREYLEAKDRKKQIRILADENLCSVGKIKDILKIEGVWEPRKYERKTAPCFEDDPFVDVIDACDDNTYYPYKEGGSDTDATLHVKEEPQTRVDETIEEAVTLDAEKTEKLERVGETLQRFMEKRHTVTFTEDEYYTVNAIALHMLDLNAKKIDRLEADLKRINEHLSEQRAVGNILRGIIEKVGGVPVDYTRVFKEGE